MPPVPAEQSRLRRAGARIATVLAAAATAPYEHLTGLVAT